MTCGYGLHGKTAGDHSRSGGIGDKSSQRLTQDKMRSSWRRPKRRPAQLRCRVREPASANRRSASLALASAFAARIRHPPIGKARLQVDCQAFVGFAPPTQSSVGIADPGDAPASDQEKAALCHVATTRKTLSRGSLGKLQPANRGSQVRQFEDHQLEAGWYKIQ